MKLSLILFSLLSALSAVASPIDLATRDVFVPPVLYPHEGTVWKIGQRHNVTWSLENVPIRLSNPTGYIYLRNQNGPLPIGALAAGFNILLGRYEIQVPNVTPGNDYQIVLMGDSGNFSPQFTITK